jgi:hypothetical protein
MRNSKLHETIDATVSDRVVALNELQDKLVNV